MMSNPTQKRRLKNLSVKMEVLLFYRSTASNSS